MGLSISKLLSGLFGKKEMRILMVGLVGFIFIPFALLRLPVAECPLSLPLLLGCRVHGAAGKIYARSQGMMQVRLQGFVRLTFGCVICRMPLVKPPFSTS